MCLQWAATIATATLGDARRLPGPKFEIITPLRLRGTNSIFVVFLSASIHSIEADLSAGNNYQPALLSELASVVVCVPQNG